MYNLKSILEKNKNIYIRHLKELVSIDTHCLGHGIDGGLEKKGQEYIIKLLKSMNADKITEDYMCESIIKDAFEKYNEGNLGHKQNDRLNVYGRFNGNENSKTVLFNGHIDVMPADTDNGWMYDPFSATIQNGKMYGRGTVDMKSGLMASIMAVKLLQDAQIDLPGNVIITSVCDEEGGGNGSIQAVMRGLKADAVVNCEPTDGELIVAHMGWVFFKVTFKGKSCHSGMKNNGVSAIEKAIKVINALIEREHEWLLKYKHPLCPAPNMNIGVIEGGTAGSTVAENCSFSTCVHFVPSLMTQEQVITEFIDVVTRTAKSDVWMEQNMPEINIYQRGESFETDINNPLIKTFSDSYEQVNHKKIRIVGSPMGCDSRLWKNIANCPTIQFGPGEPKKCHSVNENIEISDYLNAILIYANFILNWCVNKNGG